MDISCAEFMQPSVHTCAWELETSERSQFVSLVLSLFLFVCIFSSLSPLISRRARRRRDLWGTVCDIRLCISDSMMLIIRLRAAKRRGEEREGDGRDTQGAGRKEDGQGENETETGGAMRKRVRRSGGGGRGRGGGWV